MKKILACLAVGLTAFIGFGETKLIDIPMDQTVVRPEDATNKTTVLGRIKTQAETTEGKLGAYQNNDTAVAIGEGVTIDEENCRGSIGINGYPLWPSLLGSMFNISLGIDNKVGYGHGDVLNGNVHTSRYAIAIGTSNKAKYLHSYAIGSQANALAPNTLAIGYGLTAEHNRSVVIGHGYRPDASNDSPELDIDIGGRESWRYGKSHGVGTFNIVAPGDGVTDPGLASVYINDNNLAELTGVHNGESKTVTNFVNGAEVVKVQKDYSVSIGENAKANGSSGDHMQNVAIGRDADAPGQAAVAFGPNSFAYGTYGIALGWRANAVGEKSIAIGAANKSGQNYFLPDSKNGTINPDSDLNLAEGKKSIAIGFNSKAKADGSVQLGEGVNTEANTLKFQNTTIVKDGKVVGASLEALDPKLVDPTTSSDDPEMLEMTVAPHSVTTLLPQDGRELGIGTELGVSCTEPNKRNFTVYVPNEPETCAGLPLTIMSEFTDPKIKTVYEGGKTQGFKLPCRITSTQPYDKLVILKLEEMDDGTDWTPVITDCNIKGNDDYTHPQFICKGSPLIGTNLHAGVELKIAYPAYDNADNEIITTNVVDTAKNGGVMGGTFYTNVTSFANFTPTKLRLTNVAARQTWIDVIYTTKNGTAPVLRKDITFTAD